MFLIFLAVVLAALDMWSRVQFLLREVTINTKHFVTDCKIVIMSSVHADHFPDAVKFLDIFLTLYVTVASICSSCIYSC